MLQLKELQKMGELVIKSHEAMVTTEALDVRTKASQFVKNDLVTQHDLSMESRIKGILKEYPIMYSCYGEENGYSVLNDDGQLVAMIDPIDGTRTYATGWGYSSISIAFYEKADIFADGADCCAGVLITINNQTSCIAEKYAAYVVHDHKAYVSTDVGNSWNLFQPNPNALKKRVDAMTEMASFAKGYTEKMVPFELLSKKIGAALVETSLGRAGMFSGAAEIMMVVIGKFDKFINLCTTDLVSHNVAIEIARICGIEVIHAATSGDDFRIRIDSDNPGKPQFICGDGTLIASLKASEFRKIILG